jgi:hypothetical protein
MKIEYKDFRLEIDDGMLLYFAIMLVGIVAIIKA